MGIGWAGRGPRARRRRQSAPTPHLVVGLVRLASCFAATCCCACRAAAGCSKQDTSHHGVCSIRGWLHPWEDKTRYISLKNEQNRCNALRGALLLPVSFPRAVFCSGSGRSQMVSRYGMPNSHQTLTPELASPSSTARTSSHNICPGKLPPRAHILCNEGRSGAH